MTIKIVDDCPNNIRKIILNRFKQKFVCHVCPSRKIPDCACDVN